VTYSAGVGTPVIQSFQGQWVDFNEDGWLDLHVIVDRTIFPNLYYENQGNGTFVERANEVGLNIMINAMSTSVADYDRDGDMDVYVTGGLEGNRLLENVDGFFSEFIPEPGGENLRVNSLCWAACWMDEDNDGWEDVYVTTGYTEATVYPDVYAEYILKDKFFRNTGGQFLDASEEVLAPGNNLSCGGADGLQPRWLSGLHFAPRGAYGTGAARHAEWQPLPAGPAGGDRQQPRRGGDEGEDLGRWAAAIPDGLRRRELFGPKLPLAPLRPRTRHGRRLDDRHVAPRAHRTLLQRRRRQLPRAHRGRGDGLSAGGGVRRVHLSGGVQLRRVCKCR
jgi:hypothetical protein